MDNVNDNWKRKSDLDNLLSHFWNLWERVYLTSLRRFEKLTKKRNSAANRVGDLVSEMSCRRCRVGDVLSEMSCRRCRVGDVVSEMS